MTFTVDSITQKMEEIENSIDGLNRQWNDWERKLKEVCPHTNWNIRRGYSSGSGMADDRARSGFQEIKVCEDCGKYLAERTSYDILGNWVTYD
jgi:hypothetical protein